jgi:hypothetical protein
MADQTPLPSPTPTPTPAPDNSAPLPSLAQLAQTTARPPSPQPSPTPAPLRGDDLMVKAQATQSLDDGETRLVKLFTQSKDLVDSRMQQDPAYANEVMKRLQDHEGPDLVHAMIDEGDKIKIDFLKRQDPSRFNSAEAAKSAFFNTATFGQLSRIVGLAGIAADKLSGMTGGAVTAPGIQGRSYSDIVQEEGEKFRLLQKAFPKSDIAGQAAGFLIPGSPVKELFEKAAGLGSAAAGKLLSRMVQSPGLLAKAAQSAAAGAAGAGAVGAVEGTLGKDLDGISFDRGGETSLASAVGGGALGATLPVAGALLSAGGKTGAPIVRNAARGARDLVAGGIEQLTGTDVDALRAYNARPAAIRQAAGGQAEIGKNLVDFLQSHKQSPLPEVQLAKDILPQLPAVSAQKVVDFLETVPGDARPDIKSAREVLQRDWAPWVRNKLGPDLENVRPEKLREVVDDLQDVVRNQYGKDSPILPALLKEAGSIARESIVGGAGDNILAVARPGLTTRQVGQLKDALVSGKSASELSNFIKPGVTQDALDTAKNSAIYTQLMEKAAEKRDVLKFIGKQLGSTQEMQSRNAEGFIRRIFGSNKEVVRARLMDLDSKFGDELHGARARFLLRRSAWAEGKTEPVFESADGKSADGHGHRRRARRTGRRRCRRRPELAASRFRPRRCKRQGDRVHPPHGRESRGAAANFSRPESARGAPARAGNRKDARQRRPDIGGRRDPSHRRHAIFRRSRARVRSRRQAAAK